MAKFKLKELIGSQPITVRLGAGSVYSTPANAYTDKEIGKFVKLSGDSAYVLCAVGDPIQAVITGVKPITRTTSASVPSMRPVASGSCSTARKLRARVPSPSATTSWPELRWLKDTALTITTPPKVRKATQQPGDGSRRT